MMRGVSASKEDVHNAIKNIDKGIFPQAFCKIIPDILGGDPEYCNIMHADGAGTKSSLAYMYWKETGDLSVWKGIAQDALIMNIDDLLCVGAVDNILVSSTIGRNKLLVPGEVISAIINGTDELLSELREMGVGVYATGGETADVGDLVRTIIVDSTVTCRMKRSDVINNANIRPGDVIVGLASYGQATYEKEYNGGMGSNGLTSARHDVFAKYLAEKYPESYDKAVPDELVYSGKLKLTDAVEDSPLDAGKLVLSPTRTYAPVVKKLLDALRPEIHGMVHCSGYTARAAHRPRCCTSWATTAASSRTTSFPYLPCSAPSRSRATRTGRRCTRYSTWDTVWKFTFRPSMPRKSSPSRSRSTSTHRSSAASRKATRRSCCVLWTM